MKLIVSFVFIYALLGNAQISSAQFNTGGPQAGDVYKEYTINLPRNNTSWRVTDPNASYEGVPGNSPSDFLPNPTHNFSIDDYSGVERVEIVIDVWGGHVGTTGKKIRFNGNSWISIPEINTTPTSGQCYTQQVTYVLNVPITDLFDGTNSIQGTSGGQTCYNFNWGQWGWYGAKIRVYYSTSKGETTGQITSHTSGSSFSDNPTIQMSATGPVDQVDFLAKYDDYDVDGDGYYNEWVEDYQRRSWNDPIEINSHIGSITTSPYSIVWNTEWVPDQSDGAVSLIARIRNDQGYWYVTDVVSNLTLSRSGYSVQLFKPQNVPERFWVRNGQINSSIVNIPTLLEATEAKVHIRTWNGNEKNASFYTRVNSTDLTAYGKDHFFSYDIVDIPINSLSTGNNTITFQSSTADHGIEVLWPGPAIMVKYGSVPTGSVPTITQQPISQNVSIGQSANFTVLASSDSPLTYQWTKNNIDIPGEDQSTLSLTSVTPINNGSVYACKITNSYGTVISSSATLNVSNTGVRISSADDEGIDCYKIETEFAIYYFDKAGGGFVSMIDKDGVDWISHKPTPGSGSAGEYRGFPNTGELHPGYSGGASTTTSTANVWADSVVLQTSRNGEQATFTFFPSYAKMILTAIGGSDNTYWVLFEGTPGGAVGADDRVYLSNGTNFDANQDHPFGSNDITNLSGNAIGSEWMYITDGIQDRSLFLAITDDDIRDNYWQMQDNMTVFGSGREQGSVVQYRTDINAEVVIGFVESKESFIVESIINNAWEGNTSAEILLPPTNLIVSEVSDGVELNWVDNSSNELGFEIERSENGVSFTLLSTTTTNIRSFVDETVTQSNAYEYRIRAVNGSGSSNYSNVASITFNGGNTAQSLVLNLPFNGNTNDLSNNGNNGTVNGPQLTTDKDNTAGMAYSFDGSDDFIEIADSPELNVDQITMTGWIYTDSYKDDQRIISKETGTTMPWSSYTLLLSGTGERQLEFRIGIGGERFRLASTTDIPLNQWVHVAGTYDGTTMRLYINGQLNNSLAASGVIQDTPNPIYVGGSQFWPRFFDGKIDEVRIYNASLDAQEIEDIYNNVGAGPTIPQAPTSLAVQEISQGVAGLSWTDNSDNEEGFIIERQEDGGGYIELDSIVADLTSYSDSTVVAGVTYDYRIFASNAAGRSTESNVATIQLNNSNGPVLTLWYGDSVAFGQNGNPQKWVNVLGNVSDDGSINNFYYQLNGGLPVDINIGPDNRRLINIGDFNIDIDAEDLTNGSNTVDLFAEDDEGNVNFKSVTITYTPGNVWNLNSTIDWQNTSAITNEAQIVDGKWQLTNEGVRPTEIGYDRLIAIGDTTWTDYEVIIPIQIHALDTDIGVNGGNEYGIGLLMRWLGHTDSPVAGWSPKSGWEPYGEIGWFNWDKTTQANSRISFLNAGITEPMPILFDQKYLFKFRVETLPNGTHEYRLKVWLEANAEPADWDLVHTANSTELDKGSFMLIAHHVDATFGNVQLNSLHTTPPNPPSELIATQTSNSLVELLWTDNSSNEEGFIVERSIDDSVFVLLDTIAPNITSFLDSSIDFGAVHHYRILAFNNNGSSVYSDTVSINVDYPPSIPIAPTNLVATEISKTIIELSWTDNSNDEDGFIIERQENGGPFDLIETTISDENVFTDSSVVIGRNGVNPVYIIIKYQVYLLARHNAGNCTINGGSCGIVRFYLICIVSTNNYRRISKYIFI
jgi:hypothetical protein